MECNTADNCSICLPNFIPLNNGSCQSPDCSVENCEECSESNSTACSSCQENYYLDSSSNQCMLKSYGCDITWCVACTAGDICGECEPGFKVNMVYSSVNTLLYANCIKITEENTVIPVLATKYCSKLGKLLPNGDSALMYGCI